jgi:hypothetical protein
VTTTNLESGSLRIKVTYRDGREEVMDIVSASPLEDLRQRFLDGEGHYAASVEILKVS